MAALLGCEVSLRYPLTATPMPSKWVGFMLLESLPASNAFAPNGAFDALRCEIAPRWGHGACSNQTQHPPTAVGMGHRRINGDAVPPFEEWPNASTPAFRFTKTRRSTTGLDAASVA
jgi:hypothetical protein